MDPQRCDLATVVGGDRMDRVGLSKFDDACARKCALLSILTLVV